MVQIKYRCGHIVDAPHQSSLVRHDLKYGHIKLCFHCKQARDKRPTHLEMRRDGDLMACGKRSTFPHILNSSYTLADVSCKTCLKVAEKL